MRHVYYADIGGFVVRTTDGVSWPLDAHQLLYLVDERWIKGPAISTQVVLRKTDIDDRNEQNTLVRVFTIMQIV
jgi:hypothetical protein